jgi:hypothetical protein
MRFSAAQQPKRGSTETLIQGVRCVPLSQLASSSVVQYYPRPGRSDPTRRQLRNDRWFCRSINLSGDYSTPTFDQLLHSRIVLHILYLPFSSSNMHESCVRIRKWLIHCSNSFVDRCIIQSASITVSCRAPFNWSSTDLYDRFVVREKYYL